MYVQIVCVNGPGRTPRHWGCRCSGIDRAAVLKNGKTFVRYELRLHEVKPHHFDGAPTIEIECPGARKP